MKNNYEFKDVQTSLIRFDLNNPRNEPEEEILKDEKFKNLCESVREHGVLTPLIVKRTNLGYVLIDGERRLRATIKEELEIVRAIIVDSDIDGRVLAYQVHMLRKDWKPINRFFSLKIIIEDIRTGNPDISDSEIKRQLLEITNATDREVDEWIILLKYPVEVIEKVINKNLKFSYPIRIEMDFLRKIKTKYPNILKKFSESQVREILISKAENDLLVSTRYLMDEFKDVFDHTEKNDQIELLLLHFLENDSVSIEETHEKINKLFEAIETLTSTDIQVPESINEVKKDSSKANDEQNPPPDIKKDPHVEKPHTPSSKNSELERPTDFKYIKITKKDVKQLNDLRPKFEDIGALFSSEEMEYISEALRCVENRCFKAATLMIWATGISRLLSYIEKDIADFNSSIGLMKSKKNRLYNHFVKDCKADFSSIEDLRFNNDMLLVSYFFFKKFITDTQFNKLKGHHDSRNSCAHPTSIEISGNEIITIFDHVYTFILTNPKIK
jgi:ParB family chromosome partitioning protein